MRKIWASKPAAGPTPAGEVYTGSFTRPFQLYARVFYPDDYVILSAKHGFLWPHDLVPGDYNTTFKDPKTHPIGVPALIESAQCKGLYDYDQIVVVAGKNYVRRVEQVFSGKHILEPLKGCANIFIMIRRMGDAIEKHVPLAGSQEGT